MKRYHLLAILVLALCSWAAKDIIIASFSDESEQAILTEKSSDKKIVAKVSPPTSVVDEMPETPEAPQAKVDVPNSIRDLKMASPTEQVTIMEAPVANPMGSADLTFPIKLPSGRNGMEPDLSIQYNSEGENGWLGLGWNLATEAVTIETRWGVPRYDMSLETETYTINGEQLSPVAHRSELVARSTGDKIFNRRIESSFDKIIRHGTNPKNYWWEVIDKSGTQRFYGGSTSGNVDPTAILTDTSGNIAFWALAQTRDTRGNFVKYRYTKVYDPGFIGANPGSDLYLSSITYTGNGTTEGQYRVDFIRDRQLSETKRADVSISARLGFKQVTADLLRKINIKYNGTNIRTYELNYVQGAFFKTLLQGAKEFDASGALFNTHSFEYFNDVQGTGGVYQPLAAKEQWTPGPDDVRGTFLNPIDFFNDKASMLGGNKSLGGGFGVAVTIGPNDQNLSMKSFTAGVFFGFNYSKNEGMLALVDINGDGLADKVYKTTDGLVFRANQSGPTGTTTFGPVKPISGVGGFISEFSKGEAFEGDIGLEAHFVVFAGFQYSRTQDITSIYFSDVNGDGLMDLVQHGAVYFNHLDGNGNPNFTLSSADTPSPINAGAMIDSNLVEKDPVAFEKSIDDNPLHDVVKVWQAPYTGTISITRTVALFENLSPEAAADSTRDGVRVSIQHKANELWFADIAANDFTAKTPVGVNAVAVQKGDRIYFRVQSKFNGSYDKVLWIPEITYTNYNSALTDANSLPVFKFKADDDFLITDPISTGMVINGAIHIEGNFVKPQTSDDITIKILRRKKISGVYFDSTVWLQTFAWNQAINQPLSIDLNVKTGDAFFFSVSSKTNIDWKALQWDPLIYFTASFDPTITQVNDGSGNPLLKFYPTIDFQSYNRSIQPSILWTAPVSDTFAIRAQPVLAPNFETGQLVFSIKKQNQLILKKNIQVNAGAVGAISTDSLILTAGEQLFFEYHTTSTPLANKITNPNVVVTVSPGGASNVTAGLHAFDETFIFGPMYRNWGQFAYNGNRARANNPILESELVLDESLSDPTTIDLSTASPTGTSPMDTINAMQSLYDDQGGNQPKDDKFIFLVPDNQHKRWLGYDNLTYVTRDTISSSRMGKDNLLPINPITNPDPGTGSGAAGISLVSNTDNFNLAAGIGPLGFATSFGYTKAVYGFIDMNGDQYPDILSPSKIQYTKSFGGLEDTAKNQTFGDVTVAEHFSIGATLGGTFLKSNAPNATATQKSTKASKKGANASDAEKESENSIGVSGNFNYNKDSTAFEWMDINGDGLPDRVKKGGMVELNIGYSFLPEERWGYPSITEGTSLSWGVGLGFSLGDYSIAGGVGLTRSDNETNKTLMDMNGDGLLDYLIYYPGYPAPKVAINKGNGFAVPMDWTGATAIKTGNSTGESINGAFSIGFSLIPILPVVKLSINPSFNVAQGADRDTTTFEDIDGDGFVDFLQSGDDSKLTVSRSNIKRTNKLKKVNRPLGGYFTLDYKRIGNTYQMPNSIWALASVDVNDNVPGDGPDRMLNTFQYENGVFDRNEREFNGFGKITTFNHDTGNGDVVYRKSESEYINDNFYEKGLLKSEVLKNAAGNKFTEIVYTHLLKDITTGAPLLPVFKQSDDGAAFTALVSKDELYYEGQATAGKSKSMSYIYDVLGNMTSSTDFGDPGSADDVTTDITYHSVPAKYIMNVPSTTTITGSGQTYRQSATTIDNANGNITEIRKYLQSGEVAKYGMEYDIYGNLTKVERPQNLTGQRLTYTYEYDGDVQTYRTKTEDSYGYSTRATYDVRFGQTLSTTDINGQQTRFTIDNAGRLITMTGPLEIAAGQPFTISFEYHPEAAVPWALAKHFDPAHPTNFIETAAFYDGFGREIQTKKDAALFRGTQLTDLEVMIVSGPSAFDAFGRTPIQFYQVTEPKGTTGTPNSDQDTVRATLWTYDILDRVVTTTLPDLSVQTMEYGFGIDRDGATQFRTTEIDANGIRLDKFTNVRGLLKSAKEQYSQGSDIWTSYDYNPVDELLKVTDDRGNNIISTYDRMGRRTSVTHPDAGLTSFQYDLNNNTTRVTTANLQSGGGINYNYEQERLAKVIYPQNPQNNVTLTYGAPGASFFRASRVVKQQDATGTQEFFYNPLGALVKNIRVINVPDTIPLTYTTQWTYDTWNRLTAMVYPDGEQLTYNYNVGGLLENMSGIKSGTTYNYLPRMGYDKFEAKVYKRYGNGTEMTFTYEAERRRLQKLTTKTAANRLAMDNTYTYDREMNILHVVNNAPIPASNLMGGKSDYLYTYDDLYRLTNVSGKFNGSTHEQRYNLAMSYNTVSSIISKNQVHEKRGNGSLTWVRQNQTSYTYNYNYSATTKPHSALHVGDKAYTYDANGNQTGWTHDVSAQNRQIAWDEENRVKTISDNGQLFRYTYDGEGERVLKNNGNGQTVRINGAEASKTGGLGNYTIYVNPYMDVRSGGFTKHFYTEEGRIASKLGESGNGNGGNTGGGNGNNQEAFQFYFHSDHLGNTAFVTDRLGEVYQHLEYFPFGETFVEEKSNTWRTPYLYSGKELDDMTGLYYFGARYYDSRTSIWQSVDPPIFGAYLDGERDGGVFNPSNLGVYNYVYQNPINLSDPDGRGQDDWKVAGEKKPKPKKVKKPGPPPPGNAPNQVQVDKPGRIVNNARKKEEEKSGEEGVTNYGLGDATHDEAMQAGIAWVGEGYRTVKKKGYMISKDQLRQFRPPSYKPKLKKTQANFESRHEAQGMWLRDGHVTIKNP